MKGNFLIFFINYLQGLVEFYKNSDRLSLLNIDQLQGIRPTKVSVGQNLSALFVIIRIVFT